MTQSTAGGRIRESSIETLRERINLVEVVSQTVTLRRSGSRYMGKCPFHEDSSPSFLVDDKHYHCFGCKAHGDAISFEMERTGCTFVDAIESLARRFNVQLEYDAHSQESEQDRRLREQKTSMLHILAEVSRAYAQYLWSAEGAAALDYLRKRGFSDNAIKDWELGLAPQRSVLARMAEKRGWDLIHLQSAGLLRQRENSQELYDFFRDRIMIPIRDDKGMPIAFGGRVFRESTPQSNPGPKYLNSPETPVFQKSKTLFNFNRARTAIVQAGTVIVVEGYMDCLALARAGIANVVAVLGTALTPEHIRKLARVTKRVVLCFDSDNAGREAARKAFEIGFPMNLVELQFVSVPSGKDPDEFIRDNGVDVFRALVDKAMPLASWVCDFYLAQGNTRESQIRKIKSDFVPIVMRNPDPAVREVTLEMATVALGLSKVSALTSGGMPMPQSRPERAGQESSETAHRQTTSETRGGQIPAENDSDSSPSVELPVSGADEATFYLTVTHARFEDLPIRLKNVLRGEQSDEPMDEIVLAQYLSSSRSGPLAQAFLAWSELMFQHHDDKALVDLPVSAVPLMPGVLQLRAMGGLDPEGLLDAGLESWVRGVLEPSENLAMVPKLRNPSDLTDPVNLPFVRMVIRDAKVSRARSKLPTVLGRCLAQIEISYLDQEIEVTTRELRGLERNAQSAQEDLEALQMRLRKLAAERVRRYQKFIQRLSP